MSEEKKEIKPEDETAQKPKAAEEASVEAKQDEAPAQKPAVETKAETAPAGTPEAPKKDAAPAAAAEPKAKEAAPKKERPSNCAGCNKSIKKKRWYYRDGKYYCTKRCWKTTLKKDEKKETPQETKQ